MNTGTKIQGVECPECGSLFSSGRHGGYSPSGHRIRRRVCKDCDHHFNTVEVAADFIFNRVDTSSQEKSRKRSVKRPPKYHTTELRAIRASNDDLLVTVSVRKGRENPWCYKLLHRMYGDNVYITKRGHRRCYACVREARRERARVELLVNGDAVRAMKRNWYARNSERITEIRRVNRAMRKLAEVIVA